MLGKGVHAAREQKDGFLAFDVFEPLGGLNQRIEDVGFAETREIEVVNGVADFVLVLRKVHLDACFHIEGLESNPVFLLQVREKGVGPISGVSGEPAVSISAKLHEHDHGDGRVGGSKIANRLGHAFVENAEVFFLEVGNEIPVLRGGHHVEGHDRNIHADADTGAVGNAFERGNSAPSQGDQRFQDRAAVEGRCAIPRMPGIDPRARVESRPECDNIELLLWRRSSARTAIVITAPSDKEVQM